MVVHTSRLGVPWASFTPYRIIPGHRVPTWRGSFPPWKPVPRGWDLPKLPLLIGWGASTGAEPCDLFLAFLGMACSWEAEGGTSLPPPLHLGFYLPQTATPSEVGKDEKSPPKSGSVPKPLGLDSRPFSRPGNCRTAIGAGGPAWGWGRAQPPASCRAHRWGNYSGVPDPWPWFTSALRAPRLKRAARDSRNLLSPMATWCQRCSLWPTTENRAPSLDAQD